MADSGENIGGISIEITGDYSSLQSDFAAAQSVAEAAGKDIADAFSQGGIGDEYTAAFQNVGEEVTKAGDAAEEAGAKAKEGEEGFQLFGIGLGEVSESAERLLGTLGIGLGLGEIAKEGLEAYASVQKASIALTAMTGSAEGAEETIQGLKDLALQDALSFPALVHAQQRMTEMGFSAEQARTSLQHVADVAAATGGEFASVAQRFENVAFSGNASSRILVTLGLNLDLLGKALGTTADEAGKAFKALDVSDRIDVLNRAIASNANITGLAAKQAQGLGGAFTNLRTQWEFFAESIGSLLGPSVGFLLKGLGDVINTVTSLVGLLTHARDAVNLFNDAVARLHGIEPSKPLGGGTQGPTLAQLGVPAHQAAAQAAEVHATALKHVASAAREVKQAVDAMVPTAQNGPFQQLPQAVIPSAPPSVGGASPGGSEELKAMSDQVMKDLAALSPPLQQAATDVQAVNTGLGGFTQGLHGAIMKLSEQQTVTNQLAAGIKQVENTITSGLSTALTDLILHTGNAGKALKQMAESVVKEVIQLFMKLAITSLLGFAEGTDSAPGGMAWVGEKGKELVNLPRGAQVIPNHKIRGYADGTGGSTYQSTAFQTGTTNLHFHAHGMSNPDQFIDHVMRKLPDKLKARSSQFSPYSR